MLRGMTKTLSALPTVKAQETRERILDAALTLFRERGFDRTTMRDVAAEAGMATGAAYYYFRSKEDLVMAFYLRTNEAARQPVEELLASTKDPRKRIRGLIELKFRQFSEHRILMKALLRAGIDPHDPLSPFGEETRAIREENIGWYARALEGAAIRVPADVLPHLPMLLWLYHMGLIMLWIIDDSPGQRRTERVTDVSLDLILQLLRISSLPLMGPLRKRALKVLRAFQEE